LVGGAELSFVEANESVARNQVQNGLLWGEGLAGFREHGRELAILDKFADDVNAAHELALDEDLWESGPGGVKLEPLADALVLKDVESLDVPVVEGF
jgi:hypothetical protein